MELRKAEYIEKLNRLLELSALQRRFIKENRIDEMLMCQGERDLVFVFLKNPGPLRSDPEVEALACRLVESDRLLHSEAEAVKADIAVKLNHVKAGRSALRAYGGRPQGS